MSDPDPDAVEPWALWPDSTMCPAGVEVMLHSPCTFSDDARWVRAPIHWRGRFGNIACLEAIDIQRFKRKIIHRLEDRPGTEASGGYRTRGGQEHRAVVKHIPAGKTVVIPARGHGVLIACLSTNLSFMILRSWAHSRTGKPVARNIEIKARSIDPESQERMAARLATGPALLVEQEDTFFHVPRGRLKLRDFGDGTGELIEYDRPDSLGPKQSTYLRSPTNNPHSLKSVLAAALGVRAVVKKRRMVFLAEQSRIHLDEVEGLGRFIELEVVLRPEQDDEEGRLIAERLMSELGIEPSALIGGAYVDLMAQEEFNGVVEPTA